jgi:hypothetical protein
VGCDGARSAVRRALGWELQGRTYPLRLALADVRIDDDRDALPWPRVAHRDRGALAALRVSRGVWRLIFDVEGDDVGDLAPRVEEVLGAGPFEVCWSSTFRIHRRAAPRFHEGRVAIAGDAAHLVSPAGGQGMNSGIEDANDLAWTLAEALRGGDPEALLAAWDAERRGAVLGTVAHTTDVLTRGFLLAPAFVRGLSIRAAMKAFETPSLRRRVLMRLAMLDGRYTSGRVAGAGGLRAPNVRWGEGRVHDLAIRAPVVFRFGEHAPEVGGHLAGAALARAWGARMGELAMLRPDGYLGYLGPDPDALARCVGSAVYSSRSASFSW